MIRWSLIAGLVLTAGAFAQTDANQLSLGGTVINSATGEPVKRAMVELTHVERPAPRAPGQKRALPQRTTKTAFTDEAGAFRFPALAAGDYSISAQKPQFTTDFASATPHSLHLTSSMENVTLQLSPLGVITGKVVDQDGEPLRGIQVLAISTTVQDGERKTHRDRSDPTDDRGVYRFWNLRPGKYYVKAAGKSGGAHVSSVSDPVQVFGSEGFVPSYAGGAQTLESATPIEIRPGTEAHADFSLKLQPAYTVRGTLTNLAGQSGVSFELLSGEEEGTPAIAFVNGATGRFQIPDVVPGSYVLRAVQEQASAEVPITVGASDLGGVELALSPPLEIKGSVQFTNAAPEVPEDSGPRGTMTTCWLQLHPAGRRSGYPHPSEPQGDGSQLTIADVVPGTYRASISCYEAYPVSATYGTQDLLANPLVIIPPGATQEIQIMAAHGGGAIRAQISAEAADAGARVQVLLVPRVNAAAGLELALAQLPNSESSFFNLAPGSYTLYAFLNRADLEFRDPQFLQSLTGGATVGVLDKAQAAVTISEVQP